jgi:hypothetical protein
MPAVTQSWLPARYRDDSTKPARRLARSLGRFQVNVRAPRGGRPMAPKQHGMDFFWDNARVHSHMAGRSPR